jgi:hypothetical protein
MTEFKQNTLSHRFFLKEKGTQRKIEWVKNKQKELAIYFWRNP